MKLSMMKFESLINNSGLNASEFARKIGVTKNALYKLRKRKTEQSEKSELEEFKEKELPSEYAIKVMQVFKIDFSYFYDDTIDISLNPAKDHPVVDNKRFNELKNSVVDMSNALSELSKKFEKSNSSNVKVITDIANDVINEFISATIKLDRVSKNLLDDNRDLKIIVDISNRSLIDYAKRKATDFIQTIKNIDKANVISTTEVMKKVYDFKLENAPYIIQVNKLINIIDKQKVLDVYLKKRESLIDDYNGIIDNINNYIEQGNDFNEVDLVMRNFNSLDGDFLNIVDYSNAMLIRDLMNNIDVKNVADGLSPIVQKLFYDEKNDFILDSNPKTLERLSNAFIKMVKGENYLEECYLELLDSFDDIKKLMIEKGIGNSLC